MSKPHSFASQKKPDLISYQPVIAKGSSGFSLVEIMVALVIGMLSMIVMLQVFSLFEGQKRTTTGGDDAQNNGAIALYGITRDIRQSGYGISAEHLMGCNVLLRAGVTLNVMAPTTINHASIPAGDANTDTLLIVQGGGNGSSEGDLVTAQPAASVYAVQTPSSFVVGDRMIAEPQARPSPCDLELNTVASIASPNVTAATAIAGMANGRLFNVGRNPKVQAYAVRSGNLTVCDYMVNNCGLAGNSGNSAIWVPIANDIVSMRAQYGRDTAAAGSMDGVVDIYDQTTPATGSATLACDWIRIPAIRIVLTARNGQPEKTEVTAAAPAWEGTAGAPINLAATTVPAGFTWKNFRYKVFQTAIPLRNITSMGVVPGC